MNVRDSPSCHRILRRLMATSVPYVPHPLRSRNQGPCWIRRVSGESLAPPIPRDERALSGSRPTRSPLYRGEPGAGGSRADYASCRHLATPPRPSHGSGTGAPRRCSLPIPPAILCSRPGHPEKFHRSIRWTDFAQRHRIHVHHDERRHKNTLAQTNTVRSDLHQSKEQRSSRAARQRIGQESSAEGKTVCAFIMQRDGERGNVPSTI